MCVKTLMFGFEERWKYSFLNSHMIDKLLWQFKKLAFVRKLLDGYSRGAIQCSIRLIEIQYSLETSSIFLEEVLLGMGAQMFASLLYVSKVCSWKSF